MMLLFVIIEIPILIALLIIKAIAEGFENSAPGPAKEKAKTEGKDLSKEQREKIVTAIIEDALLINDRAFDSLINTGEALYNGAEASLTKSEDFDLQYGSKVWLCAWTAALSRWFDCNAEYSGNGVFHVYGKEA